MGANQRWNEVPGISRRVPEKENRFSGQYRQAGGYPLPVTSPEAIYLPQICIEDLVYAAEDTFPFRYTEGVRNRIDVLATEEGFLVRRNKAFKQKELHWLQARVLKRFGAYTVPYDCIQCPGRGEDAVHLLRLIPWHIVPAGLHHRISHEAWQTFNQRAETGRFMKDWRVCALSAFAYEVFGIPCSAPAKVKGGVRASEVPTTLQPPSETGPNFFLCDIAQMNARIESEPLRSAGSGGNLGGLNTLSSLRHPKHLIHPQLDDIGRVRRLKDRLPNFAAVTDAIGGRLMAQYLSHNPTRFPPILLLGDPGVGKSYFTKKLAEAIDLPFESVAVAGSSQELHITGLSKGWGSAGPSRFAEILAGSTFANPLILVDEIDKAGHIRVENALLQIFEPETAARWVDQYVEVPLDLSRVLFIATANDAAGLSPILLSRFEVFDIAVPDQAQLKTIFASIYEDELRKFDSGALFAPRLPDDVIGKLVTAAMTPRAARRALIDAMERAIVRTHSQVGTLAPGSVAIQPDDLAALRSPRLVNRIGFI